MPPRLDASAGECTSDVDCVVTTLGSCCGCCRCTPPRAELRTTAEDERDMCARKDCAKPDCRNSNCPECVFASDTDRPGKCSAGRCVMP